jgi:hypothetical protein
VQHGGVKGLLAMHASDRRAWKGRGHPGWTQNHAGQH